MSLCVCDFCKGQSEAALLTQRRRRCSRLYKPQTLLLSLSVTLLGHLWPRHLSLSPSPALAQCFACRWGDKDLSPASHSQAAAA